MFSTLFLVPSHVALWAALCCLLLFAAGHVLYALWFSPYSHIPGPRFCKISRLPLALIDLKLQRSAKVHEWHQKYGPVVLIAPGEVSFCTPSSTREIYGTAGRHPKSHYFDHFISYGERATFNTLDYEKHRQRRKISFAFFQATSIHTPACVDPVHSRVVAFLEDIDRHVQTTGSTTVDFFSRVNLYAFDNITQLIFGSGHSTRTVETPGPERDMLEGLKHCELWNPLLFNFPLVYHAVKFAVVRLAGKKDFLSAEDDLTAWSERQVAATLEDDSCYRDHTSLLSRLQQFRDKQGDPLPASWVKAETLDNLNAAQTTATVALTYVLYNIARSPVWQERIRQELLALPAGDDGFPSFAAINSAPVLEACVKESYRLNPLSSGRAERVVPLGKEYDGVFVPKGTVVSTSTLAIQHDPSAFPQPGLYDPGRWLNAGPDQTRFMEMFYIPWGYGARVCLGKAFATLEVKLLVAYLLLRYRISEDAASPTNADSMMQLGTQDALPKGLRCDLRVEAWSRGA
ncbi:Cytochrome P450 monooxygenase cypX [Colletotrichum spinosum]|uniref:Cytochrome P450 monooxygenase cypX n=1 Tax=Colletotrichum spinosum TaxID=1347390 RepID=A0A4V3HSL8_9PEZI|nr:Cytochrome P450 monooxygenase cypX [Colletotrichum spinosum]